LYPTYLERQGGMVELTGWVRKFSHQECGLPLEVLFLTVLQFVCGVLGFGEGEGERDGEQDGESELG